MADVLIVGGGVIGLSLAYELAGAGVQVRVVERGLPGREASWAGAGILPPAPSTPTEDPYEQLFQLSNQLHASWAAQLREETGIDNGLRRCGGIYVSRRPEDDAQMQEAAERWRRQGIACEILTADELARREPSLNGGAASAALRSARFLPDEMQVRNPRHLKALLAGCARRGVKVDAGVSVDDFEVRQNRIQRVYASSGAMAAGQICLAGGPWTTTLLARLGVQVAARPVRGQIALLNASPPLLRTIVNEGSRYLVPRPDGRILVGSTEEEAGFEKRTTAEGIAGLLQFALEIAPGLAGAQFEQCWAGLRPCAWDRLPLLGQTPGCENAFVATAHFRSGLQLSTGTAAVLARLVQGRDPGIDLRPFRLNRP